MTRIAILRCQDLPSFVTWDIPDIDELFAEHDLLIAGFSERGLEASSVVWRDTGVDWDQFDAALIRSTWDYIDHPQEFIRVLERIDSSSCRLFNPLKVVRWNSHKRYLFDLEKWGVATVPTYSASVSAAASLERVFDKRGWEWVILKAAVGAMASDVHRVRSREIAEKLAQLLSKNEKNEYLVQPFVEPVKTEGEWSFIFFNGELSHVLLKKPALDDYRAHGIYGGTVESAVPDPADRAQAHSIISRLPFDLLFARLDLVRVAGRLAVIELELIEPILYFNVIPEAIDRLVGATLRSLEGK